MYNKNNKLCQQKLKKKTVGSIEGIKEYDARVHIV